MRIEERIENQVGIFSFYGNLNSEESAELKSYLVSYLKKNKIKGILFDFINVKAIDSSGIALIVNIYKVLKKMEKKLVLTSSNVGHKQIFNLSRLDRFLMITNDKETALKLLES